MIYTAYEPTQNDVTDLRKHLYVLVSNLLYDLRVDNPKLLVHWGQRIHDSTVKLDSLMKETKLRNLMEEDT